VFRRRLGHAYHAQIAIIATVISGKETDADFVKKVEIRRTGSKRQRRGDRIATKINETVT
jgi:hypothetical protein